MRWVGTAASVVLLTGVLVSCGSEVASPDDGSAPEPTASDSAGPADGPVLRGPGRRLVRCLHSSTVPADDQTDPPFWFPSQVECPPTVELHQEQAS